MGLGLGFVEEKQTSLAKPHVLDIPYFTNVKLFLILIIPNFSPSVACGRYRWWTCCSLTMGSGLLIVVFQILTTSDSIRFLFREFRYHLAAAR